jgi:hypothetical protein
MITLVLKFACTYHRKDVLHSSCAPLGHICCYQALSAQRSVVQIDTLHATQSAGPIPLLGCGWAADIAPASPERVSFLCRRSSTFLALIEASLDSLCRRSFLPNEQEVHIHSERSTVRCLTLVWRDLGKPCAGCAVLSTLLDQSS